MMKSELVVKASLFRVSHTFLLKGSDLPADTVLLHLPTCTILPVEDTIGVVDVFLQSP